jgi:hypothetical protein
LTPKADQKGAKYFIFPHTFFLTSAVRSGRVSDSRCQEFPLPTKASPGLPWIAPDHPREPNLSRRYSFGIEHAVVVVSFGIEHAVVVISFGIEHAVVVIS